MSDQPDGLQIRGPRTDANKTNICSQIWLKLSLSAVPYGSEYHADCDACEEAISDNIRGHHCRNMVSVVKEEDAEAKRSKLPHTCDSQKKLTNLGIQIWYNVS